MSRHQPRYNNPRRIGSPAHTRSILKDYKDAWKARELERLQSLRASGSDFRGSDDQESTREDLLDLP